MLVSHLIIKNPQTRHVPAKLRNKNDKNCIKLNLITLLCHYYNNYHYPMANIIQLNNTLHTQHTHKKYKEDLYTWKDPQLHKIIYKYLQEYTRSAIVEQQKFQGQTHIYHMSTSLFENISAIISIRIDTKQRTTYVAGKLVHNQDLSFVSSLDKFKYLCAKSLVLNNMSSGHLFAISVGQSTGLISWKRYQKLSSNLSSCNLLFSIIKMQIQQSLNFGYFTALKLAYFANKITPKIYFKTLSQQQGQLQKLQKSKLVNFTKLKQLLPFLTSDIRVTEKQKQNKQNKKIFQPDLRHSSDTLRQVYAQHSKLEEQNRLFWFDNYEDRKLPHTFEVNKEDFQNQFGYPSYREQRKEKTTIFNQIIVLEQKDKERFLTEGGKARIYLFNTKMKFAQDLDNKTKEVAKNESQLILDKSLLGKIPKKVSEINKMDSVRYERQILANLKDSKCAYFPRYYYSAQKNYSFSNYFLMDFIQKQNLNADTQIKHFTYALRSKLILLIHIANAIRFLQAKNIAHIDLSPNNILVDDGMMIKVIDFGQAYSEQVTRKYVASKNKKDFRYNPGRTVPFTAPEVYLRSDNFDSQQDIFSLGVICFKLIFGSYPFRCSEKVAEKVYKEKDYMHRLFLVPEIAQDLGNTTVYNLLLTLIMKLLNTKQQYRPTPTWTYLIFKKLLQASQV